MMISMIQKIYFWFILPIIVIIANLVAIFSKSVRKGFYPRLASVRHFLKWANSREAAAGKTILMHAASMGEFEHIKPVLQLFKIKYKTRNIVSFFSPSGYEHVQTGENLDYKMYMPLDFMGNWEKILTAGKIDLIFISKHDVWPGLIWTAKNLRIPVYLLNASLSEKSSRIKPLTRNFLGQVYRDFTKIFAISTEDENRFHAFFPGPPVSAIGDTKYDQVVYRKIAAEKSEFISPQWAAKRWVFIAGSIWPEDENHLLPALEKLLEKNPAFAVILVPHQPTPETVTRLQKYFSNYEQVLFSERQNIAGQRIVIIDAVGYLAGLYKYGNAAYVGGSFRQGIHNVMEPAIYGIPVLYGPVHRNSYEAIQFAEHGSGQVVENSGDCYRIISGLLEDENYCREVGTRSEQFARANTGATEKILSMLDDVL